MTIAKRHPDSAVVGIIMGSDTDLPTMQPAVDVCREFGVACEVRVISAHRTPAALAAYARGAERRGLKVIVAGAGGAAHLPGVAASHTVLPVIGVPVMTKALRGLDSLASIMQMPTGVPVATVAIDNAKNAGLLAIAILAAGDARLRSALRKYRVQLGRESRAKDRRVRAAARAKS